MYYNMHTQVAIKQPNGSRVLKLADGGEYVNATAICAAFGKHPVAWLAENATNLFIDLVMAKTDLECKDLVLRVPGDNKNDEDHWVYKALVPDLMEWLSDRTGLTVKISYKFEKKHPAFAD